MCSTECKFACRKNEEGIYVQYRVFKCIWNEWERNLGSVQSVKMHV